MALSSFVTACTSCPTTRLPPQLTPPNRPLRHPALPLPPPPRLYDALSPFIREEAKTQLLEKLESLEVRWACCARWARLARLYRHYCSWSGPCLGLLQPCASCLVPSHAYPGCPCATKHALCSQLIVRLLTPHPPNTPAYPPTHPPTPQNWLYEEGEEETKSVYVAKLGEVKALGGPVEARAANAAALPAAADALRRTCQVL